MQDIVHVLVQLFRLEGYQAKGFHRGTDVLEAAQREKPDAVILDIAMPGLSGFGVAQQLRAKYGKQTPLLIAYSGELTGPTDKMLGGFIGFDHYLVKPADFKEFVKLLEPLTK